MVPSNKVGRQRRFGPYLPRAEHSHVELSAYSRSWPCFFPQHGPGKKHERTIELVDWQRELLRRHPERRLAGPPNTVYVSRFADVAKLDRFVGPKA